MKFFSFSMAKYLLLVPSLVSFSLVYSENSSNEQASQDPLIQENTLDSTQDVQKISEAFGHLIAKNIETLGFKFDIAQLIKGLQDSAKGIESPMSEMECVQAISDVQEALNKKQAEENLSKANEFLAQNAKEKNIISTEEGKLQYRIDREGNGAEVQLHYCPLVRYTGKFLDGTVFGSSKEDEMISLDETIPGITNAMVGMKEGEKRTIFIHPDLGYGSSGQLPPNSLLTFEVEVIKAQSPQMQEQEILTTQTTGQAKLPREIAAPDQPSENLR